MGRGLNMRKRVLSIVTALALCLGMLPTAAAAEPIPTGRVYVYNGERQKPEWQLRVTHPDGTDILLEEGINFSVTYEHSNGNGDDLTNVGTVIANLVGITVGFNYFYSFEIAPAPLAITGLSGNHTKEYDGGTDCDGNGLPIQFDGRFHNDDVSIRAQGGTYTYASPDAGAGKEITLSGASYVLEGLAAGNYYIAGNPPDTLKTSSGEITKGTYGKTQASSEARFGASGRCDLGSLLPPGAALGSVSVSNSGIFAQGPSVSDGVLTYTLNAQAQPGSTSTDTIPVESTNYKPFDLTVTVTVLDKYAPELTVAPITHVYNGEAVPDTVIKGTATVDGKNVPGTWSFAEGQALTNVADSGTKTVKFVPTEGTDYAEATGTVVVTINKAVPTGAPKYTAISAGGKTLADAGLTTEGGAFSTGGAIAWTLPDTTEVTANTQYEWIFTPNDTANYNTLAGKITLWVRGTEGSGYVPSSPSTPSAPSNPTLPVTTAGQGGATVTTTTTAVPTATTQGGKTTSIVDTAMGNEIVKQAIANNSETVVIAPKATGSATRAEVSIPASTVGQIGSQTHASLTISTPVADVAIPNGGLGSLSSAGGTVIVITGQTGNTVELSVTAGGEPVEHVPGGMTLTVPMGNATPGTVAVLVHENGTREVVRKSVADNGAVAIPLEGSAKLEIVDNGGYFADVPTAHWAADAVAFTSARELFNGTAPGQFSPDAPMSRGMLAVVLHNLENNPAQAFTGAFTDVDSSQWYAEGVFWAAAQGIIGGYGNGIFGPNDNITREQLAVMLWRYAGSPASTERELHFVDAHKAGDWAKDALLWAAEKGILNGKGGGILDPGGYATRAETAQMLKNFIEGPLRPVQSHSPNRIALRQPL